MPPRTKNVTPIPGAEDAPPADDRDEDVIETVGGEPRALVIAAPSVPTQGHLAVGVGALAAMSDEDFERNLSALRKGVERADQVKRAIMKEDEDYGLIPGTKSPTLLKPGAEKLALAYGLVGRFVHHIRYGDGESDPPILVVVDSFIHLGDTAGPVVAQGMGMASSWEKRYRYRGAAGRRCPKCGVDNVIRSNQGGWWCGRREGGCGASFPDGDQAIEGQPDPGRAENLDPHELGNTLLKMAEKRAYVDGVLRATASSGLFTQDMEDDPYGPHGAPPDAPREPRRAPEPQRAAQTATPAPAGAEKAFQALVEAAPDGIRHVKPDSAASRKRGWSGDVGVDKLEVVTKANGRKHTAMLFNDVATATERLQLQPGEAVSFVGATVEEHIWQEGKPPQKQLWDVTDVLVLRDGAWVSATGGQPTLALPVEEAAAPAAADPTPAPASSPSPPTSSTTSTTAAPSTSEPPPDLAPKPVLPPLDKTDERREDGLFLVVREVQFTKAADKAVGVIRASYGDEAVSVAVGDVPPGHVAELLGSEAEPKINPGDRIAVVGFWRGGWLVAEDVA